jgi:hypothetical protein
MLRFFFWTCALVERRVFTFKATERIFSPGLVHAIENAS